MLDLLKDKFGGKVLYHPTFNKKELDLLLLDPPMVIDAKYKPRYNRTVEINDMRQLSGYSRLRKVYDLLKVDKQKVIDCLVIYPNRLTGQNNNNLENFDELLSDPSNVINEYVGFYKISVDLPCIK